MIPDTAAPSANQYQIFRAFIGKLADSSAKGKRYMYTLLLLAVISNGLLAVLVISLYGRYNLWALVIVLVCFVPTLLTYILYTRLRAVCDLPEQLDQVQVNVEGLNTALRDSGVMSELGQFISKKEQGLKGRIQTLIKIAPSLVQLRGRIDEVLQVDVVFTLLSVGNPLFAGLFVAAIFPVVIWLIATLIAVIVWIL